MGGITPDLTERQPQRMMRATMATRWKRRLRRALADVRAYDAALTEAIAQARADGATWQELGEELGTTAQAAHARFAKKITTAQDGDPEPDEAPTS
jgi:hypothetical protein